MIMGLIGARSSRDGHDGRRGEIRLPTVVEFRFDGWRYCCVPSEVESMIGSSGAKCRETAWA